MFYIICKSTLWDSNLTWYTENPDFTPCFHKTVLVWIPCGFLWSFLLYEIRSFRRSKKSSIPWSLLNISKIIAVSLLISTNIRNAFNHFHENHEQMEFDQSDIIKCITHIVCLILMLMGLKFGIRRSGVQCIFWLLSTIAGVLAVRSFLINQDYKENLYTFSIFICENSLVFILFALSVIPDKKPKYEKPKNKENCARKNKSPEDVASFFSLISYSWLNGLLKIGYEREITFSDLPALNKSLQVSNSNSRLEGYINKDNIIGSYVEKGDIVNVQTALLKAFGSSYIIPTVCQLFADFIILMSPLFIKWLINFASNDEPMWKGVLYCCILLLSDIVKHVCIDYRYKCGYKLATRLRSSTTSALYKKSLRLSSESRSDLASGTILNCMAVDSTRFRYVAINLYLIFNTPILFALGTYLLWTELGISSIPGMFIIALTFPINLFLAKISKSYQDKLMFWKDKRVKLLSEILNGVRILKMYAWERSFQKQVDLVRNQEAVYLKKSAILQAVSSSVFQFTPFLVTLVTFAIFVSDSSNVFSPATAFVSLQIFCAINLSLRQFPTLVNDITMLNVSFKRINKILNSSELENYVENLESPSKYALKIINGSFSWSRTSNYIVREVDLKIPKGILAAVIGKVGSGKSSLFSSLLGDMNKRQGKVLIQGSLAYVPQQAWIQNTTLKNNIIFNSEMDRDKYEKIIEACALDEDIDTLPSFDESEIGEKGINLSGGQKQRVSLARAVYLDRDIYLLDDPLGAVDSHTAKHIFEKVIGYDGLLKNKTRILVTHNLALLPEVDIVYIMQDGRIKDKGTYEELLQKDGTFKEFLTEHVEKNIVNETKSIVRPVRENTFHHNLPKWKLKRKEGNVDEKRTNIISKENSIQTTNTFAVLLQYLNLMSVKWTLLIFFGQTCIQTATVCSNYWLSLWSEDYQRSEEIHTPNRTTVSVDTRLAVFATLNVAQAGLILATTTALLLAMLKAALRMHRNMISSVLRCPLTFFDTTPVGRILNRFSSDLQEADQAMNPNAIQVTYMLIQIIVFSLAISIEVPLFIIGVVICSVIFFFIARYYIRTFRQLKGLFATSNSPLITHFSDTLAGSTVIRSLKATGKFTKKAFSLINENESTYFILLMTSNWMRCRINILGSLIFFIAAFCGVLSKGRLSSGTIGYVLTNANTIIPMINFLFFFGSWLDCSFISIKRIFEYFSLKHEGGCDNSEIEVPNNWPEQGKITFWNYSTRYREGLDLILKNISFVIKPMEKVGIVGRTGAGKSSLALALFRMIEPVNGQIIVDGQDISKLKLHDLRSRITIIPQDPVLYSSTLRFNLDPFDFYSDDEIWKALELSHLKTFVKTYEKGLNHEILEGGQNLSVGQRQLVCLARALLRKTKILLLDEATASVDMETDELIQATIREEFQKCTVITIAHRINTIMDYDRVLVLSQGSVVEFDQPVTLLKDKSSIFYELAVDAGVINH